MPLSRGAVDPRTCTKRAASRAATTADYAAVAEPEDEPVAAGKVSLSARQVADRAARLN